MQYACHAVLRKKEIGRGSKLTGELGNGCFVMVDLLVYEVFELNGNTCT